jgi:hypothetical protein
MKFPLVCQHPLAVFFVIVIGCRIARDFYPLNNFPMYADPGPEPSEYLVLRDGTGALVNIKFLTGETSAKVGKKYIKQRNDLATRAGIQEAATAGPEICAQAWRDVAESLKPLAKRRKRQLPAKLTMERGMIYQEAGRLREEFIPIGTAEMHSSAEEVKP